MPYQTIEEWEAEEAEEAAREAKHWREHKCPNGKCGYFDYYHGPRGQCPRNDQEAMKFFRPQKTGE